jgi:hypothetical protein
MQAKFQARIWLQKYSSFHFMGGYPTEQAAESICRSWSICNSGKHICIEFLEALDLLSGFLFLGIGWHSTRLGICADGSSGFRPTGWSCFGMIVLLEPHCNNN